MATPGYVTPEFAETVSSNNLLRTRIMLKDSMVLDPTGKQFSGMLEHAKRKLPDLFVPYDGGPLEDDQAKWDQELMNQELSLLVNNFSYERIGHLWRVIRKTRSADIQRMEYLEKRQQHKGPPPPEPSQFPGGGSPRNATGPAGVSRIEKKQKRANALFEIQRAGGSIEQTMEDTRRQGKKWTSKQVDQMKQAAEKILAAVEQYEKNK